MQEGLAMMSVVKVLAVVLILWAGNVRAETTECEKDPAKPFRFSVISRRNQTGHWTTQVVLDHTTGHGEIECGPWRLDLDQSISTCEGEETVHTTATVSVPPQRAGPDYQLVPGLGYYKLHTDIKNWDDARKTCIKEGAHLAIINSEAEAEASVGIWSLHPKIRLDFLDNYLYVGFHDIYKEGEYLTVFGKPQVDAGYLKWNTNEPSGEREDCGTLVKSGLMNDISCDVTLGFLCEQEL